MHAGSEEFLSSELKDLRQRIDDVFSAQRSNRLNVGQSTAKERISKLKRIHNWICDNKKPIREALYADFGRAATEVDALDLFPSIAEIKLFTRSRSSESSIFFDMPPLLEFGIKTMKRPGNEIFVVKAAPF